jgi:Complex1_LYR-like
MSNISSINNNKASTLYRSILRAHKKFLPTDMKQLGDVYVKSEFRLHKNAKLDQSQQFFIEWENYLHQITITARAQEMTRSVGALSQSERQQQQQYRPSVTTSSSSLPLGQDSIFQFGKDLPHDLELSEEQIRQLEKLRDEAMKTNQPGQGGNI